MKLTSKQLRVSGSTHALAQFLSFRLGGRRLPELYDAGLRALAEKHALSDILAAFPSEPSGASDSVDLFEQIKAAFAAREQTEFVGSSEGVSEMLGMPGHGHSIGIRLGHLAKRYPDKVTGDYRPGYTTTWTIRL